MTPLQKQYSQIKAQYPDSVLFFRMGDFYEGFGEDAKIMAKVLGITLTARDKAKKEPMAGFPHHAIDAYLYKMVKAGYKAAICEQLEDPKQAKGIVKRGVVKVVTPGTITDEKAVDITANNYILSLDLANDKCGIAYADLSTGLFKTTEIGISTKVGKQMLIDEIARLNPSEILVCEDDKTKLKQDSPRILDYYMQFVEKSEFDVKDAQEELKDFFKVKSLKGFGIANRELCLSSAGALLKYLKDTQKNSLAHLHPPTHYNLTDHMLLDAATMQNLELVFSSATGNKKASLLGILDQTKTSMGARLLRSWVLQSLIEKGKIEERLEAVESFTQNPEVNDTVRETLEEVYDLERLASKLGSATANPKDLVALKVSLKKMPQISDLLIPPLTKGGGGGVKEVDPRVKPLPAGRHGEDDRTEGTNILTEITNNLSTKKFLPLIRLLSESLNNHPPTTVNEGGIIKDGYNTEVDEIKEAARGGKEWLKNLQAEESEKTGITNLKVKFNKIFGYYIEVTKSHLDKVPEHYIRKQTLVNAERYITPELKKMEDKILGANEKMITIEYQLFVEIREKTIEYINEIQTLAYNIAKLDVLANFGYIARYNNYVKPEINEDGLIDIKDGRHPVVEELSEELFVPNDTVLDHESKQLVILTGPNMSGKSTYIRQVALITLMAQIGSFVSAKSANISVTDRIFTRVGANDNLSQGESTFMVEMNETANILNNATEKSLIILDEVGRGTSTYDGVSIAWAVAEYIHNKVGACTLFATHYHELLKLERTLDKVHNINVAVEEINTSPNPSLERRGMPPLSKGRLPSGEGEMSRSDKEDSRGVIFLRKIVEGGTDQSYGVHVAQLAGIPKEVIDKANEILAGLEQESMFLVSDSSSCHPGPDEVRNDPGSRSTKLAASDEQLVPQMDFFSAPDPRTKKWEKLKQELETLDLDNMTPLEAMKKLEEMKNGL